MSMEKKLRIISFTGQGCILARKIGEKLPAELYYKFSQRQEGLQPGMNEVQLPLGEWAADAFDKGIPLLFIGAAGIAVRAIAGAVRDKLTDIPVLVMDMEGRYVIPILSGHYGGANELAERISMITGAVPVITTGTDIMGGFAADVFARKNALAIMNPEVLPGLSGRVIAGGRISVSSDPDIRLSMEGNLPAGVSLIETPHADGTMDTDICITVRNHEASGEAGRETLYLVPGFLHIGIGCKKDTDPVKLAEFALRCIRQLGYLQQSVASVSSIENKKDEKAIIHLAEKLERPFITYTAGELAEIEGIFRDSEFVRETVGVGNVSARAAARSAGRRYRLLKDTVKEDGMTFAAAVPEVLRLEW